MPYIAHKYYFPPFLDYITIFAICKEKANEKLYVVTLWLPCVVTLPSPNGLQFKGVFGKGHFSVIARSEATKQSIVRVLSAVNSFVDCFASLAMTEYGIYRQSAGRRGRRPLRSPAAKFK
jgi:hypothetical protein